jgi:hypothetical protein
MAEIVNNLFGLDPAAIQQQRELTDINTAYKFAQLDPMQKAQFAIARGAAGLGRDITGFLGGDEQLQKATKVRELSAQFDMTTPEGLRQFAQAVSPFAPDVAAQATQRAADLSLTSAKTTKALRETRIPTSGLGKLITELDDLIASGATESDPRVIAYRKAIAAEGEPKGTKVEVKTDLGSIFEKAFTKKEAEDQGEQWAKAGAAYGEASQLSANIRTMESVLGNSFTGKFANFQLGLSKALGGSEKASNTEVLDALSAQLVLPLAKLLPGSLAVKELDQLIKTKPNIQQEAQTIQRLLNQIKRDLRASEITYEAGEKYRKENKGSIVGFNPNMARNRATRLVELQNKFQRDGKLTDTEKAEARKIAEELKVEAL